jgi:hypothetical protein
MAASFSGLVWLFLAMAVLFPVFPDHDPESPNPSLRGFALCIPQNKSEAISFILKNYFQPLSQVMPIIFVYF